jgi:Xaa-Pro dipeptidase
MRRRHFLKATAAGTFSPLVLTQAIPQTGLEDDPKKQAVRSRIKPITREERLDRQENARRLMREHHIDALLCEGGTTLTYYTGVTWGRSERLFAMILPRNGEPVFVAPRFEESRAREQVSEHSVLTWEEHQSPYELVRQILEDVGTRTGTLAIEESTRFFITHNIGNTARSVTLVDGTPITAGCRSVKSAHELELMQIANDITREVFQTSVTSLTEGMTEREFGRIVSRNFSEWGVGGGALILFGGASAHPHGLERENRLKSGDIVLIDGGCSVEGYVSDVTRTTVFGTPTQKMREVWQLVRKAQDAGLAAARPGVPAESVDAAARAVITGAGFGPDYTYFTHRLGHGIGMEGHEWYYLVRGNTRPLESGNVFSNEPGIYIVGEFGIRLEDEMVITEDGARLMLPQANGLDDLFG